MKNTTFYAKTKSTSSQHRGWAWAAFLASAPVRKWTMFLPLKNSYLIISFHLFLCENNLIVVNGWIHKQNKRLRNFFDSRNRKKRVKWIMYFSTKRTKIQALGIAPEHMKNWTSGVNKLSVYLNNKFWLLSMQFYSLPRIHKNTFLHCVIGFSFWSISFLLRNFFVIFLGIKTFMDNFRDRQRR